MKGDVPDPGACVRCALGATCLPASIPPHSVYSFQQFIRPCVLEKGELLYQDGDPFRGFYVVQRGAVKLHKARHGSRRNFRESVRGFCFGGDIVGLDGLESGQHCYGATALDTTSLCWVSRQSLLKIMNATPSISLHMLRMALRSTRIRTNGFGGLRAAERIASFLIGVSRQGMHEDGASGAFRLPMQRTEIGDYLGIASETVSRVFSDLSKEGIINADGRHITILDRNRLEAVGNYCGPNRRKNTRSVTNVTAIKSVGCM